MLPIIIYLITGIVFDIFIAIPIIRDINKKAMEEEFEENTFSTIIIVILLTPIVYPLIIVYAICIIIKRLYNKLIAKIKQTNLYIKICDYLYIRY